MGGQGFFQLKFRFDLIVMTNLIEEKGGSEYLKLSIKDQIT